MATTRTPPPPSGGFGMTITTTPEHPPGLADVAERLKKNKPIWSKLRDELSEDPANFQGNRFLNDRMPRRGQPKGPPQGTGHGGGYKGRIRLRPADKKVSLTSSRPYLPGFTDRAIDDVFIPELLDYWLEGE